MRPLQQREIAFPVFEFFLKWEGEVTLEENMAPRKAGEHILSSQSSTPFEKGSKYFRVREGARGGISIRLRESDPLSGEATLSKMFASFLKMCLLKKERICSPWEQILFFKSRPLFKGE